MSNLKSSTQTATFAGSSGALGQFLRFAVVGVMNSVINFAILNILAHFTRTTSGVGVIGLGAIAFIGATTNSYFMNKNWSFKDQSHVHEGRKVTLFLTVSLVGLLISTSTVYFVTTYIKPPVNLLALIADLLPVIGPKLKDASVIWLNLANVLAICLALVWNFFGYKKFVFKPI